MIDKLTTTIREASKAADALLDDKARIDWLARNEVQWEQQDAGWRVSVMWKDKATDRWKYSDFDAPTFREALTLAMQAHPGECAHSFVAPQSADGRSYLNRRVCRKCGEHRKLVGTEWVVAAPPADLAA